jgi:outer membrane protein assembly factor BamB
MMLRGPNLLVEAEQLYSLNTATGQEQWQFPLNCFSKASCNTRIRHWDSDVFVLSGFDGKDDNLMLVNAKTGARLWPTWVEVPTARFIAFTPSTLVVATAQAPYAIVGLNRYTGRERWQFRPEGTESPAAGLEADEKIITTWWSSKTADSVYSIDLDTGSNLGEWMIARRPKLKELRGGGPGFFFAYQPSVLGGGGSVRAWNNRTGEKLWRKSIKTPRTPTLLGAQVQYWTQTKNKASLTALSAQSGAERWSYERRNVQTFEASVEPGHLVLRMAGKSVAVIVLNIVSGQVVGIGPLEGTTLTLGRLRLSGRFLFAMNGTELIRLEARPGTELVAEFDQLVNNGDMKAAEELHARILPFVDDIDAAASIHRKVRGRDFRRESARMQQGGLPALLPYILTSSTDKRMLFYEDFKTLLTNTNALLKPIEMPARVKGNELKRLKQATRRVVELVDRFERKLNKLEDKEMYALIRDVVIPLSELLTRSRASADATHCLHSLFSRSWMIRTDALKGAMRNAALEAARAWVPRILEAAKGDGSGPEIITELQKIRGFELIDLDLPTAQEATTRTGMAELLQNLRDRLPK